MQYFFYPTASIVFTVGLLWTSDQPVAKASTYTGQHNRETEETNIHTLSGIRTRDPSNQAAADLRLRPRGHRNRQTVGLDCLYSMVTMATQLFNAVKSVQ
jgi:hypothetical protein